MAGEHPEDPFDIDAFNAWTVGRRSGLETREVLTLWGEAADSFLAHCASISEEDWASKRYDYVAGPIAARYLVQTRVVEWWLHGEDVRATNGLGPDYQHWPVHLTIDLAVRMLPGRRVPASTCQVRPSGSTSTARRGFVALGFGFRRGPVGPSQARRDDRRPAPQLALVAGQRLKPDDVLSSGNVVLGGERLLADTVLRYLRAFP